MVNRDGGNNVRTDKHLNHSESANGVSIGTERIIENRAFTLRSYLNVSVVVASEGTGEEKMVF